MMAWRIFLENPADIMTTPKVTTAIVMTVRMIDVGSTMNVSIDTVMPLC
jgi:hypothetical protein